MLYVQEVQAVKHSGGLFFIRVSLNETVKLASALVFPFLMKIDITTKRCTNLQKTPIDVYVGY